MPYWILRQLLLSTFQGVAVQFWRLFLVILSMLLLASGERREYYNVQVFFFWREVKNHRDLT